MDIEALHNSIWSTLPMDLEAVIGLEHANDPNKPQWTLCSDGLLLLDNWIYVPDHSDLCLQVLWNLHDHLLSRHFGQNRTLEAVRRQYTWPNVCTFVCDYVNECRICGQNKSCRHRPYGLLKPLLGILYQWISLNNYQTPMDTLLSW